MAFITNSGMEVPQKIKNKTTLWLYNLSSGYISKRDRISVLKDICTSVFMTALLTRAKAWNQTCVHWWMNGNIKGEQVGRNQEPDSEQKCNECCLSGHVIRPTASLIMCTRPEQGQASQISSTGLSAGSFTLWVISPAFSPFLFRQNLLLSPVLPDSANPPRQLTQRILCCCLPSDGVTGSTTLAQFLVECGNLNSRHGAYVENALPLTQPRCLSTSGFFQLG